MANTEQLLSLIPYYSEAFADPEDPTLPEPDEEGRTGETPQDGTLLGDAIASNPETMHPDQVRDFAEGHLQAQTGDDSGVIEFEQKPRKGGGTLRPLDEVVDEVSAPIFIDLPETHARQGSAECPSGLCEL
jgi:hypothetical protein